MLESCLKATEGQFGAPNQILSQLFGVKTGTEVGTVIAERILNGNKERFLNKPEGNK